jgi:hypothetical protein
MNLKYPEPKNVRAYSQHQMQMFPPTVRSLIEDDHLCLVVDDVVKVLDLSCLYQKVSPEGNPVFIYQCKSCRQCQFFGQRTTNANGRTISRHPYEKQLKQMREK